MNEPKNPEIPIEILPEQLSADALAGVIENFIVREGTDYGAVEVTLEKKSEQIRKQIERGEVKIVFDQNTESIGLLTARDFNRLINLAMPVSI